MHGGSGRAAESLLERLRVVQRRPDGVPAGFTLATAELSAGRDDGAVIGVVDRRGPARAALDAAAVRRHCGSFRHQYDAVPATAVELRRRGGNVLTIAELSLFDPALLSSPGVHLVPVDDERTLRWTPASVHRRGSGARRGWLPFGQVAVDWRSAFGYQPNAHPVNNAGLGAGRSLAEAREAACRDLLAQDVAMTWWTYGLADGRASDRPVGSGVLRPLKIPGALAESWRDTDLGLQLFQVKNVFDVPVVLARVLGGDHGGGDHGGGDHGGGDHGGGDHGGGDHGGGDHGGGDHGGGDHSRLAVATDADFDDAAQRAVSSTLTQLAQLAEIDDHPGSTPDRNVVEAAGPGFASVRTPLATLRLTRDETVARRIGDRLGAFHDHEPAAEPSRPGAGLSAYDALLAEGHDLWLVDVTTPEVAADGWRCVRVVSPRLARIPVAAYPVDPYGRVRSSSERLGWSTRTREKLPFPGHTLAWSDSAT